MYLKSIEINGFKSFANKIVFKFDHGFVGIVGPNGSGKSNVGDAFRWVLGEQSAKQLRGARMEDVIFSGTENRKPLGFAYVAITMDNSDHSLPIDYEEVVVARRVYRSGESEYLLNGSPCRLKDVTNLFMDTGVGKEGYSIIGQGQIDKILSGKPEERRELFDEAAGIVKYKKNKAATEKSLAQEQENLSRVNDILSELEKQVGPLKKQSETAKQYLSYKEELKEIDVNVFLLENERIKEDLDSIGKKKEIVSSDLKNTKEKYEETKEKYEKSEKELEVLQEKVDLKKNEVTEIKLANQKYEGEVKVFAEQINTAKANDQHIGNRLGQIETSLEQKKLEKDKLYSEKTEIDDRLDEMDDLQQRAEQKSEDVIQKITDVQSQIDNLKMDIIEYVSESANLKAKVERYDQMLEYISQQKAELNQRRIERHSIENEQKEIVFENTQKYDALKLKIENNEKETEDTKKSLDELKKQEISNRKAMEDTEQNYHRTRSKLETLKNLTERYDGYGNSIRKVMDQKERTPGLVGVVADIIRVKKEYEIAIETALGGSIQNIVTKDENTAKQMIAFLKKNRFGRATFLPLTSISNRYPFNKQEALKENGVIGLASTLVDVDEEYRSVTEYLLGRTIVVDEIDHALMLARKYHYSLRIVTIEGESLNPGGSMTGGTFKSMSNLLSRRREIEEAEQLLIKNQSRMKDLKEQEENIKSQQENLEEKMYNLSQNQQAYQLDENTIVLNLKQAKEKLDEVTRLLSNVKKESEELDKQVVEIENQKKSLFEGNEKHEEMKSANEEKIEQLERELEKLRIEETSAKEKVTQIRLDFSSLEQKNNFIVSNIKRIRDEEKLLFEEQKELSKNVSKAALEIAEITAKIDAMKTKISENGKQREELEKIISELEEQKEKISLSHKEVFQQREELNSRISELDKEEFRLNSSEEKLNESMTSLNNYMWEEYELTYHKALELRKEEFNNLATLKKSLSEIRIKIKSLGDVNVNAIEDYKEVSERYEFLRGQHDDIVNSEENLRKVIEELDVAMRRQFNEKFTEIREMFQKVFKELFGGGKADLSLMDEEDVLETGIIITAQPPGKKLQNMMQLSGGEKALTAIALLFAIQNLKPSPFCLLDEIEAALDDANVDRFANYLHKLTAHTQFIVITHRRGTMTAADILYGITMQEKGVSTLVSVNLIEEELEKENRKE